MEEDLSILDRRDRSPDRTLAYGNHPDQVADVRVGMRGVQLPLAVLIHGGFWKPQYDRAHVEAMSSRLADAGWTTLTLEYRRIPGKPDATLDDIRTAIMQLPAAIERQNGKIILIGHSAGGHLALRAAAQRTSSMLQGVLALAPAADLRLADALHLGDEAVRRFLGTAPDQRPDVNPVQLPVPAVPVIIVQGQVDDTVPPAVAESYCAAFPRTRLVRLPDAGHFAPIDPGSSAWPVVLDELRALSGTRETSAFQR